MIDMKDILPVYVVQDDIAAVRSAWPTLEEAMDAVGELIRDIATIDLHWARKNSHDEGRWTTTIWYPLQRHNITIVKIASSKTFKPR